MKVATRYFAFDLGQRQVGLIRRTRDDEAKTSTIEQVRDGRWIDNPDLLRFFAGYGGDQLDLVPLTEEQALRRASELDVSL